MKPIRNFLRLVACFVTATSLRAAEFDLAATATNQLGVDLHRKLATGDENHVYAIQHVPSRTCLFLDRVTDPR
jgi:hypothetical protein